MLFQKVNLMRNKLSKLDERIAKLKEVTGYKAKKDEASFRFSTFSPKQKKVLTWWCDASPVKNKEGIIADGAIRSGKTLAMSLSFGIWAMTNFDRQNFLLCGKTIGSLRRNVVNFWRTMMTSAGYKIKEVRTDNLIIVTKGKIANNFYLFGGKDEKSQDLVQGITAAGVLFDEVALMPESFINQATGRCSVAGSKFWFNCNPEGSSHWFKTKWIDKQEEKKMLHLNFTMDDNNSLAEEIKQRYRAMYAGVFYRRYILGEWCIASGVVYDMFEKERHVFSGDTNHITGRRYYAIDYGTINPMVFLEIVDDGTHAYIIKEYYYNSKEKQRQKTDREYAEDLVQFIGGKEYRYVIIDPSAASFKAEMRSKGIRRIRDADNAVLDGIRKVSTLLNLELLSVHESCTHTINEFNNYVWNEKSADRGVEEPVKQSDHALDCIRYFTNTVLTGRRVVRGAKAEEKSNR